MYKKLTPLVISLSVIVLSAFSALAQGSTVKPTLSPSQSELRQELLKQQQEKVKTQIDQKKQELKKRLDAAKLRVVTNYFDRMSIRLGAAFERENKLIGRVESRINKFAAGGAKVDDAKKNLADAKVEWQKAKDALDQAKIKFEALKTSDDPKAAFQEVKQLVKNVVDSIKQTHAAVVKTITSLKGASSGVKEQGNTEAAPPAGGAAPAPQSAQ